jgi:hypothetical protein
MPLRKDIFFAGTTIRVWLYDLDSTPIHFAQFLSDPEIKVDPKTVYRWVKHGTDAMPLIRLLQLIEVLRLTVSEAGALIATDGVDEERRKKILRVATSRKTPGRKVGEKSRTLKTAAREAAKPAA